MTKQYCLSRPYVNGEWTWTWYSIWDITHDTQSEYEYWEKEFVEMYLSFFDYFSINKRCVITFGINFELKYLKSKIISNKEIKNSVDYMLKILRKNIENVSTRELEFLFKCAIRGFCHISLVDLFSNARLIPTDEGLNYYLYLENDLLLNKINIPKAIQIEFLGLESLYAGEGFDS